MSIRRSPSLDLGAFDLRAGVVGLLAISFTLILIATLGPGAVTAAVAALIAISVPSPGEGAARLRPIVTVTLVGTALTALGVWAGEEGWVAALVMMLVTSFATLSAAYGRTWATAGYLLNLWVLLALMLTASEHSIATLTGAFLIGGLVGGGVDLLRSREPTSGGDARATHLNEHPAGIHTVPGRRGLEPLREALSPDSPLFRFGLVRGLAAGSATLIGWYLFDAHPYWAVLTAFVILQTEPEASIRRGVQRTVGTAFGVLLGIGLVQIVDGTWPLVAIFATSAFLMIAVQRVSYALFSFFVTLVLLAASRIATQDIPTAAVQRLEATALGAGLAIAAVWLGTRLTSRPSGEQGAA